ncbi:MAG: hypothetical protein JNK85_24710 [Verrucomicrobiales bacterium]|nr:hypothetical protein [Verrucomicrobiales bacterium]
MKSRAWFTFAAAAAILTVFLGSTANLKAADKEPLHEKLEPLRPFLGKTWRGEFKNSTPDKPQVDIARWERALNGQAIRILHSINNGVYGGESLVFWDASKKEVVYYYFTTAGFYTTGVMTVEGTKVTSREAVTGSADGVTEVKATTELKADGTMQTDSQYLKKGEWVPGHGALYREAPEAKVVFK